VTIKVGAKSAITNSKGYFRITSAALDKNASHVTAQKAGYFPSHRTFQATQGVNQVVIQLIPKVLAGTINAGSGGEVSLANGAKVSLPANAVVSGQTPFAGTVNVYAAYIDPTAGEIAARVPGSFMADDKNNVRVTLASYGMMAVELESSTGEKLQIASGKTAQLINPIPSSIMATAPASISLWYLDEASGLWKEEGTATKSGNNYVGDVKHFSFWNCDISIPAVNLSLTLHNVHAQPIAHASVRIRRTGPNVSGQAYGYTDTLGRVSGLVPANENLVLEVLDPCANVAYSQNISPLTQATNLGVIVLNATVTAVREVTGRIVNCNGQPVTNGYAIINFNNLVLLAATDALGKFNVSFMTCQASATSLEVVGVDNTNLQQGTSVTVPITGNSTNTGDITACGVSASQYIQYNLNGVDYSMTSAGPDSLLGYTFQQGSVPFSTLISGFASAAGKNINVYFSSSTMTAGTYPVSSLSVNDFQRVGLIAPFNITVTSFPAVAGNFYEGSFTGQFRDSANLVPLHTISGTFRIRR